MRNQPPMKMKGVFQNQKHRWNWLGWAREFARSAADFVYPPACRLCAGELAEREPDAEPGVPFCHACREGLLKTRGAACVRCGATIGPYLDPNTPCAYCRKESYAFDRVFRLGVYDETLRIACLRAKVRGSEPLAAALGELVWELEQPGFSQVGIDVVMPVPHHWLKRFYSPHNAAETLGSVWAARLKVPLVTHILRKRRWTRSQARLLPSERRINLRHAFGATAVEGLKGAVVLLADDVMTTGTTAHEISKVLVSAGAARVVVAVVARGLGRR